MSSIVLVESREQRNFDEFGQESIQYNKLHSILKFLQCTYGDLFQIDLDTKSICILSDCMNMYTTCQLPILPNVTKKCKDRIFQFHCSVLLSLMEQKLQCSSVASVMFKVEEIGNRLFLCVANWPNNDTEVKVQLRPGDVSKILNITIESTTFQQCIGPSLCSDVLEWISCGFLAETTYVEFKISATDEVTIISHQTEINTLIVKKRKTMVFDNSPKTIQENDSFLCVTRGSPVISFNAKNIKSFLELFRDSVCMMQCSVGEPLHLSIENMKMIVVPYEK